MATWAETLQLLRTEYVRDARASLDVMTGLLEKLESGRSAGVLPDLTRRFHGLAGAGFTYGFPEVSALGRRGEKACRVAVGRGGAFLPAELAEWRAVLRGLRREFGFASNEDGEADKRAVRPASRPRVLLVDDDATVWAILVPLLESDGMSVLTAATLAEASSKLEEGLPDAMVVDIMLPDGLGYEIVQQARTLPGGHRIPILVLSALSELDDRVQAVLCGADGFFGKPAAWGPLRARLQQLLSGRRPRRSRVLVIEKSAGPGSPLRDLLATADHEILACPDFAQVDSFVARFDPDLVLADVVGFPGDGRELALQLQGSGRDEVPVLVLSADASPALLEGAADRTEFLDTPIPAARMLSIVAAHLERGRLLRRLREQDHLTGLLNHTAFQERASASLVGSSRAVYMLVDIDDLTGINQTIGHRAGDRALSALGAFLRKRVRYADIVGRIGGPQLAVLLHDLSEPEAAGLAERLCSEFAAQKLVAPGGAEFSAAISAGVTAVEGAPGGLDAIARAAMASLREAKAMRKRRLPAGRMAAVAAATPAAAS
jgi:diguanylate cyclase (GGDEF)-like protein